MGGKSVPWEDEISAENLTQEVRHSGPSAAADGQTHYYGDGCPEEHGDPVAAYPGGKLPDRDLRNMFLPPKSPGTFVESEQVRKAVEAGAVVRGAEEVRATSSTGGEKGRKPEEYALIPVEPLAEVARVYGYGATKYSAQNWRSGYPYSWSLSALMRHIEAFRRGESYDPESGLHHLAHAEFHLNTLMHFDITGTGEDDRADAA